MGRHVPPSPTPLCVSDPQVASKAHYFIFFSACQYFSNDLASSPAKRGVTPIGQVPGGRGRAGKASGAGPALWPCGFSMSSRTERSDTQRFRADSVHGPGRTPYKNEPQGLNSEPCATTALSGRRERRGGPPPTVPGRGRHRNECSTRASPPAFAPGLFGPD